MERTLVVEHVEKTSVIRINRPGKKNALTRDMLDALADLLAVEAKAGARAIVLTGGKELFSAGADIGEIGRGVEDVAIDEVIANVASAISCLPIPVIAAIEGPCVGAAVELVLTCDVRVAAQTAYFLIPATRLGILYRPGGIAHMVATVGKETTMRLLLLGEKISGADAGIAGIASHIVAGGGAIDRAIMLASLSADYVPEAVTATKEVIVSLSASNVDLARFEGIRQELLGSVARGRAVDELRERLGT